MRKRIGTPVALVSMLAWSLLWTSPSRSESVFDSSGILGPAAGSAPRLELVSGADEALGGAPALFSASGQDSVETFDVELEEEEGPGIYKEVVMVAIVAAAVGYLVYMMIDPGEEEEASTDSDSGKPIPFVRVPFSLSR